MAAASFRNREEAGRLLARQLEEVEWTENSAPLVFAVPKGGVPVARPIADILQTTLDVAPGAEADTQEPTEFSGLTADNTQSSQQSGQWLGRDCIIVDDVIANGAGAIAAIKVLRKRGVGRIFVACAIVTTEALKKLRDIDDVDVVSVHVLKAIDSSISDFFDDEQVITDDEVRSVQSAAQKSQTESNGISEKSWIDIHLSEITQPAQWLAADKISGVVLIFNSDGDATESHEAVEIVEQSFADAGLGALSITMYHDDDVTVLSQRVRQVTNWLESYPPAKNLPLGFFAVGLGGAAVLAAAASTPERVKAVVCCDSPLNYAQDHLARVHAPTLLIATDEDGDVVTKGRQGLSEMQVETSLSIISGSSERIGVAAVNWMNRFLLGGNALKKTAPSEMVTPASFSSQVAEANTDLAIL